jgi:hypothetical protein
LTIEKVDLGTHEGIASYDGIKLDKIYFFDEAGRTVR